MAVVESRLKSGILTLDGTDFACQVTAVRIVPADSTGGGGDTTEVLCGDVISGGATGTANTDTLEITAISDFKDANGLVVFSWKNRDQTVPFEWQPTNDTGDKWTGRVTIKAIPVGGTVNERLTESVSWPIAEAHPPAKWGVGPQKNRAKPGDTFPAEATVTASDATNAAKLAGLGFVALPQTAWTTGQKITVGAHDFHWAGNAWAAGAA